VGGGNHVVEPDSPQLLHSGLIRRRSMTRRNQKLEERSWVEMMRRGFGGLPNGNVESAEEPDVRIVGGGKCVGIEVTELHMSEESDGPPRRAQEGERALIVERARELSESRGLPVLCVSVHFNDHVLVSRSDRERIAQGLSIVVANNVPDMNHHQSVEVWRQMDNSLPAVLRVSILRPNHRSRSHWSALDAGWVQSEFMKELQESIDAKAPKLERYLRHCDECWLLVVASGSRPSGLFEPDQRTLDNVYRSPFSKTLFLEAFVGTVVELKTMHTELN
jgi:hypothetical protein